MRHLGDFTMEQLYKKWPIEVQLNEEYETGPLLQYDLSNADNRVIPFQIVEWYSSSGTTDWDEEDTSVIIIYKGEIWSDGIRHSNFYPGDSGYAHYLHALSLSKGLKILHDLCLKYTSCCYDVSDW